MNKVEFIKDIDVGGRETNAYNTGVQDTLQKIKDVLKIIVEKHNGTRKKM